MNIQKSFYDACIFISYSRADQKIVTSIVDELRSKELNIWQDVEGEQFGIPYSTRWMEIVEEALYKAKGAIIIKTENWISSKPCSWEYELIQKNRIPYIFITEEELKDIYSITESIMEWNLDILQNEENFYREYLFSNGYRLKKTSHFSYTLPNTRSISEVKDLLNDISALQEMVYRNGICDENEDIKPFITKYLSWTKRVFILELIAKKMITVFGIAGILSSILLYKMIPNVLNTFKKSIGFRSGVNMMREMKEYDPVGVMSFLTQNEYIKYINTEDHFFKMQQIAVELLSFNYPYCFFDSGSQEALNIIGLPENVSDKRFSINLSDSIGKLIISDRLTDSEEGLFIDCIPTSYFFVSEKDELIFAAENKVYVYDLNYAIEPVELSYNFETVKSIRYRNGIIYAVTEKGNVVGWKDPITERKLKKRISNGWLYRDACKEINAFHLTNHSIVFNNNNKESELIIDQYDIVPEIAAISSDGMNLAIVYINDEYKNGILLINLQAKKIEKNYETEFMINGMTFSKDNKKIVAACKGEMFELDLNTERIINKPLEEEKTGNLVLSYKSHYLIVDDQSQSALFNENLQRESDWFSIVGTEIQSNQVALSEVYGSVFTVNQGGNYCIKTNIESGQMIQVPFNSKSDIKQCSSVAVSLDGALVAFGYPDGKIFVWDVYSLNNMFMDCSLEESIVALEFSEDNSIIYALGESGNIYGIEGKGLLRAVDENNYIDIWNVYKDKLIKVHEKMYRMGLTHIAPDKFL